MRKAMATQTSQTRKTYALDGTQLEVCSCKAPCPCWIGEDPDDGRCDAVTAYHIEHGQINGIDVSGFSLVNVVQVPGNMLKGNWRAVIYLDDRASAGQRQALLDAFCGKLGGPLVSLASLVGERIAMIPAPIEQKVEKGKGTLRVGNVVKAEMTPYTDRQGRPTALHDTAFSTIAGSPAYVARAQHNWVSLPEYGMIWEYSGRNAIQGHFHFEA